MKLKPIVARSHPVIAGQVSGKGPGAAHMGPVLEPRDQVAQPFENDKIPDAVEIGSRLCVHQNTNDHLEVLAAMTNLSSAFSVGPLCCTAAPLRPDGS